MAKFKIGDKIIGNDDSPYTYTKKGWKGEVNYVSSDGQYINAVGIEEYENTREFSGLNVTYFDLYVPSGTEPDNNEQTPTSNLTRSDVYNQLFGGITCLDMCPCNKCSDCPLDKGGCSSEKRQAWWSAPFTGKLFAGTRVTRPRLSPDTAIEKTGIEGLCEAYNISDSAGLAYLGDNKMCKTEAQQKELETLILLNELLFVWNSDTCSHEDYRERYTAFLRQFGVAFDNKGFAYVESCEDTPCS